MNTPIFKNSITQLFGIDYPIVQAGMVWVSGWRLAAAVSKAGGLGMIGAGSMTAGVLDEHIRKLKQSTQRAFAVNIPLHITHSAEHVDVVLKNNVPIVFTAAGNPNLYTETLKKAGIVVVHVVSSTPQALKAAAAGCDALVCEGFEAGGHNGANETTSLVLIPAVCNAVKIPVIAAGGIATGQQMLAAMVLGAQGVQVGSLFVCSQESSAHNSFKEAIVKAKEGDTMLSLKKIGAVRLLKNKFFTDVQHAEQNGATETELRNLLGKGKAKQGMFEGDIENGELEIGQVSSLIHSISPASQIVHTLWQSFERALQHPLGNLNY